MTTGSATDPSTSADAAMEAEQKAMDRRLRSICRGCGCNGLLRYRSGRGALVVHSALALHL